MRIATIRVLVSAGTIGMLLTLISVATALAGDGNVPLPR